MPFTVSHIAAVLPITRPLARWRVLSATIIGSMTPDFGLLLPWRPTRVETHGAMALLTFCLPVGLATFWIYQQLIKSAIVEILPDAAYRRWQRHIAPADITSVRQWALAAAGVLTGAVSHLVWDAFTHEGARGVRMIPALDDPVLFVAGHHLDGARLLQDVSSLVGLAIVTAAVAYGLRPDRGKGIPLSRQLRPSERWLWVAAYMIAAGALALVALQLRWRHMAFTPSLAIYVANVAIAALRGCAAALLVVSVGLSMRLRANR